MSTPAKKKAGRPLGVKNGQGKPKKPHVNFRDRFLYDMHLYFRATDWSEMWKQWYLAVDGENAPKYRTIRSFAKAQAESKEQKQFLLWYLGPLPEPGVPDLEATKYPFISTGPVDWVEKRNSGGWFTDKSLKAFGMEITRRMNALDALREAGKITLNSLVRAEQLAQRLDEAFNGTFFIPGMTFDGNARRAELYLSLHDRILTMKGRAQDLYAKSHGVNFDDMSGLQALMQASALAATIREAEGHELNPAQSAIKAFVQMTLAKAARYDLPLPEGAGAHIIDVVNQDKEKADKKKKLQ